MCLPKKIALLLLMIFYAGFNPAIAQLWRYIGYTKKKADTFEKYLSKEAVSVVTKQTVAYGDTMSYDIRTYAIRSFDGRDCKIRLWDKPFDGHVFHIDCAGDKLEIPDFSGLARVHILNNYLLEIVYSPRGGSDQGYDNVLILGIDKGKFCIVMEIQSVSEYQMPDEYGLYNLHFKLTGQNADNYQLGIRVREILKTTSKSKKGYDLYSNYVLKFDKGRHVFYKEVQSIDAVVDGWDKQNKNHTRHIKGNYPVIKLGEYEYCFMNSIWYSRSKETNTGKYSYLSYTYRPANFK